MKTFIHIKMKWKKMDKNKVSTVTNHFATSTYKITEVENKVLSNLDASNVKVQNILLNILLR